jgi:hypothetical protein
MTNQNTYFIGFAQATMRVTRSMYDDPSVTTIVKNSWTETGIAVT